MNIGNLERKKKQSNEGQQKRRYNSSKCLPHHDESITKNNTFRISNLNTINKIGLVNPGYNNYNPPSNFNGPYLPQPMQGIPGNQMYNVRRQIPLQKGGQTLSSAQTLESHFIYTGNFYKQNNFI